MYLPPETDPVTVSGVEKAVGITGRMLEGIGMAGDCISVMKSPEDFSGFSFSGGRGIKRSAGRDFISEAMKDSHDKRSLILKSLQILYDHSGAASGRLELPPEAHFAGIRISKEKCTLCMACASVCPVRALTAGTDHPRLNFCEAACTSCGICMKACPEKAIDLVPGIPLPPEEAWAERVLGEEPPFLCIQCGKSFAAQATISRITDKLRDHWMYRDPEAVNRLRMCRDCRISDYFSRDSGQLFE